MRIRFGQLLDELSGRVKTICSKARTNLATLEQLDQYESMDPKELKQVRDECWKQDEDLRDYGDETEDLVAKIFLLQAPVGRDLRITLSAFRLIYEFERISREARNIVNYFLQVYMDESTRLQKTNIKQMINTLQDAIPTIYGIFDLFTKYFDSYYQHLDTAQLVINVKSLDKIVNVMFRKELHELGQVNKKGGLAIHNAFLLSLRATERIGDHTCNIIERVCYIINGKRIKI